MKEISIERLILKARIWLDGYLKAKTQSSTISGLTPPKDHIHLYAAHKANVSNLYFRDDAGVEHDLSSGGVTDHGALTGLADDDHLIYLLTSDATSRVVFTANWLDLTDGGATTLHSHAGGNGSAWSILTNGDTDAPEPIYDSNGDVMMTETCGGSACV
jgi:hypothetical protein